MNKERVSNVYLEIGDSVTSLVECYRVVKRVALEICMILFLLSEQRVVQ